MNKANRQARSQQMHEHIQGWQQSTLTQKDYCLQNNLSFSTFYYWSKKLRKADQVEPIGFVSLMIKDHKSASAGSLQLRYPNGVQLSVPVTTDLGLLSRLVRLV